MQQINIGIIGGTSLVGDGLLPLFSSEKYNVIVFSRKFQKSQENINWQQLENLLSHQISLSEKDVVPYWISLVPIKVLVPLLNHLEKFKPRRILVLSSTSLFSKRNSPDQEEQIEARNIYESEKALEGWAEGANIKWTILRPTLIYGRGRDRNISIMSRIIRKIFFFPIFGEAQGLRQPVHADDVAWACFAALFHSKTINRVYTISGGEVLTYKEMVSKIFLSMGRSPRFVEIPFWMFQLVNSIIGLLGILRQFNLGAVSRMNIDQAFDHKQATEDFSYRPRPFTLRSEDIA